MNDTIHTFKQLVNHPHQIDAAALAQLKAKYPYFHALYQLEGTTKEASIFGHSLWDASHLLEKESSESKVDLELASKEVIKPVVENIAPANLPIKTEKEAEENNVTVYHDEHLPYSFLWWLNKTRMDYADTYKPYANPAHQHVKRQKAATADSFLNEEAWKAQQERALLDQQIRENIFHLQEPEKKMSQHVIGQDIAFSVPKQSNPVIEKFILEEPKISPPKPDKLNLENKARKSASDDGSIVTETLAKIYEEQGLYPKALEVYEKLSLKFPEKSGYFAVRITELKNKLI